MGHNRVLRIDPGIRVMPGREAYVSHQGIAALATLIGALASRMCLPFASRWSDQTNRANG